MPDKLAELRALVAAQAYVDACERSSEASIKVQDAAMDALRAALEKFGRQS